MMIKNLPWNRAYQCGESGARPLDFRLIPLTQGKISTIDASDFNLVNVNGWHALKSSTGGFYAAFRSNGMHRLIMNAPKGVEVDHRDMDGLNNRRSNLRLATHQQNAFNRGPSKRNRSGIKGVRFVSRGRNWEARINICGKLKSLGRFSNKNSAAIAYINAAKIEHGEFARTEKGVNNA